MNRIIKIAILFLVFGGLFSCDKDDSTTTTYVVPLEVQEPIDDAAIIEFLTNNYFNEEEFNNVGSFDAGVFKYDIKFSEDAVVTGYDSNGDGIIDGSDADNTTVFNRTALIDLVETKTITVLGVDHTLYILKIEQGLGLEQPRFCDEAFLSYEGMTLDKEVFDNQLHPIELDLAGSIKGFSESVSEFNIATGNTPVGDGTFTYENYGVGAAFMPSGLGYYSRGLESITAYSPLIFKLKVYGTTELDHDGDGVPTYVEDLNDDRDLTNDDTDLDGSPNYIDANDDNDPILTKEEVLSNEYTMDTNNGDSEPVLGVNEYEINREETTPGVFTITTSTYIDTDGDGVLDYLDADS